MDSTIYKKIMAYLLDLIGHNASIPHYRLPSERVIALKFDSSRKPVRHAYEKLIELGYVTNVHGSGYFINENIKPDGFINIFQEKIKISFILPSVTTKYAHSVLSGITDFCTQKQLELSIHISNNLPETEAALLRKIPSSGAQGIILFPVEHDYHSHLELTKLLTQKYPFVFVDRCLPNLHASLVCSDGHLAMLNAVEFLYKKQFKNPVFATPPSSSSTSSDARINGYTHGLLKYYKAVTPRNLLQLVGSPAQQKNIFLKYLQQYPDTDVCILYGVQLHTITEAIREGGLQIPQDITLMTFDDELTYEEHDSLKPYIIYQDGYQIGYSAAENLYNQIHGDMRPVIQKLPVHIAN